MSGQTCDRFEMPVVVDYGTVFEMTEALGVSGPEDEGASGVDRATEGT